MGGFRKLVFRRFEAVSVCLLVTSRFMTREIKFRALSEWWPDKTQVRVKTGVIRRVRARGLQIRPENRVCCRPGPPTGRLLNGRLTDSSSELPNRWIGPASTGQPTRQVKQTPANSFTSHKV